MKLLEALADAGFCRVADAQNSSDNTIRLLRDGTETYPAWLAAIRAARRQVHLENYILEEDAVGETFAAALMEAAKRGAKVRVIYDWMGCLPRTKKRFWIRLREAGVEVRCYNPPHLKNPFGWISRDHRKVLCVDQEIAFTGGLCIGHDWAGDPSRDIPPWRDTAIQIEGPAVAQIDAAFADSWAAAGHEIPPEDPSEQNIVLAEGVTISLIAGKPRAMSLYRLEQLVAEIAERSLWLTDGYFVATTGYVRALANAARSGVDVRLLVPGSSNWPIVGALSKSAYRPLLEAGVRVFEWNGPMLHAKTAVADGCWSRIGSSNSNLASWVSNRELDVTINDLGLARQMEEMYERDLTNATEVVLQPGRSSLPKPVRSDNEKVKARAPATSAGRFISGAIGFGSTLTATLSQHRPLGVADAFVLVTGGCILLALGLIAAIFPRVIAYPVAFAALWFAIGFLIHAGKLWRAHRRPGETS